jgi:hypothetical protein
VDFLTSADLIGVSEAVNRIGGSFMAAFFLGVLTGLLVYIVRKRR